MKKQLIFDKQGMVIKAHRFGWVSRNRLTSKLKLLEGHTEKVVDVGGAGQAEIAQHS